MIIFIVYLTFNNINKIKLNFKLIFAKYKINIKLKGYNK